MNLSGDKKSMLCGLCNDQEATLCSTCVKKNLNEIQSRLLYNSQTVTGLKNQIEDRLTKLELHQILADKKAMITKKKKLIEQKKALIAKNQESIFQMEIHLVEQKSFFNDTAKPETAIWRSNWIEQTCIRQDKQTQISQELQHRILLLRKFYLAQALKTFMVPQLGTDFLQLGDQFQVNNVKIIGNEQEDFVMIEFPQAQKQSQNQHTDDQGIPYIKDWVLDEQPIIKDYFDSIDNKKSKNQQIEEEIKEAPSLSTQSNNPFASLAASKTNTVISAMGSAQSRMMPTFMQNLAASTDEDNHLMFAKNAINAGYGRQRADTCEEFENDNMELKKEDQQQSNDQMTDSFKTANDNQHGHQKQQNSSSDADSQSSSAGNKENKTMTRSYIVFNQSSDYDQGLKSSRQSYGGYINRKQQTQSKEDQIQGKVHMLCLLLQGISIYTQAPLPYQLSLTNKGFVISDNHKHKYGLYLRSKPNKSEETKADLDSMKIEFEFAITLLDKNIQYLLHSHHYDFSKIEDGPKFLDIKSLQEQSDWLAREPQVVDQGNSKKRQNQNFELFSINQSRQHCVEQEIRRQRGALPEQESQSNTGWSTYLPARVPNFLKGWSGQ